METNVSTQRGPFLAYISAIHNSQMEQGRQNAPAPSLTWGTNKMGESLPNSRQGMAGKGIFPSLEQKSIKLCIICTFKLFCTTSTGYVAAECIVSPKHHIHNYNMNHQYIIIIIYYPLN